MAPRAEDVSEDTKPTGSEARRWSAIRSAVVALALAVALFAAAAGLESLIASRIEDPAALSEWRGYANVGEAVVAGSLVFAYLILMDRKERGKTGGRERYAGRQRLLRSMATAAATHDAASATQKALEAVNQCFGANSSGIWFVRQDEATLTLRFGAGRLAGSIGAVVAAREPADAPPGHQLEVLDPFTTGVISGRPDPSILLEPAVFLPIGLPSRLGRAWLGIHGDLSALPASADDVRPAAEVLAALVQRAEQQRLERIEREVEACLAAASFGAPRWAEVLERLAGLAGWPAAELWWIRRGAEPARLAAWSGPEESAAAFIAAGNGASADGDGSPLPFSLLKLDGPLSGIDLHSVPGFLRTSLANEAHLEEAFAIPWGEDRGISGAMVFYGPSAAHPPQATLDFLLGLTPRLASAARRFERWQVGQRRRLDLARKMEHAPLAIARWDASGIILECNSAELDLVGYPRGEYFGRHFSEFQADPEARKALGDALRDGKEIHDLESRLIRKDGTLASVLLDLRPSGEGGVARGSDVFMRDVSSLKERLGSLTRSADDLDRRLAERTEELLRLNQEHLRLISRRVEAEQESTRSESRFRSLIEHLVDIVVVLDGAGVIRFVSPSVERRLGHSAEALVGSSLYDLVHPDDLVSVMNGLARLIGEPARHHRLEFRFSRADGTWAIVEAVGRNNLDEETVGGVVINLRDVTERVASQEALRESEERFALLVRGVRNYAIALLDPGGRVVSWNEAAARMQGYDDEEIVGQSFVRFYPQDDQRLGTTEHHLEAAIREGRLLTQGQRVRKDGSRFWAEVSLTPLYDREGELRGFAEVTRDITERREAEEKLRRSENLLSEAQRLAQIGGWEWDILSDEVRWSEEMGRILGRDPDDLQGSWERFLGPFHPDDREAADAALRSAAENGQPFEFEHRIVRPDGQVRTLRGRGRPEIDDLGRPTRVIGIGQDITERQQIEDALRTQTELYLSMLLAQSELGEGVLLTEGDTLIYANHALEELFGSDAASARSLHSFLGSIDPHRATSLRRDLEDRIDKPLPPARGEAALTRADGSQIHIGYTVMAAGGSGPMRTFAILRDETDRRQALEALEASREQLRQFSTELERAREEESARISREIHDELGQHLTGLKLDLSWLAARLEAAGGESAPRLLDKARGMTRLVDETIEQVRRIASELRPGVLDDLGLSAALEWQAAEFESRTGIHCRLECDDAAETVPPDHATAMFRIFQEALTNVARHAQAQEVQVRLKVDEGSLLLTIEDDGRGIADDEIRASTSLGLLGLRERAWLLGGETTIRRRNTRGTIVQVALPLPAEQTTEARS